MKHSLLFVLVQQPCKLKRPNNFSSVFLNYILRTLKCNFANGATATDSLVRIFTTDSCSQICIIKLCLDINISFLRLIVN